MKTTNAVTDGSIGPHLAGEPTAASSGRQAGPSKANKVMESIHDSLEPVVRRGHQQRAISKEILCAARDRRMRDGLEPLEEVA